MPSSRGSSQPRNQTRISHITGGFFTNWATRNAQIWYSWGLRKTFSLRLGIPLVQFSSVAQSCPTLYDPMNRNTQASLSITSSQSPLKHTSIVSVIPSNHLILCHPLLLLPSIFPSIRVFSNESALCIRWPKYWSLRFYLFMYFIPEQSSLNLLVY